MAQGQCQDARCQTAAPRDDQFTVVVKHGDVEEIFPNLTLGRGRGARNAVEVVNRESKLVRVAERESTGTLVERAPTILVASRTETVPLPPVDTVFYRPVSIGEVVARVQQLLRRGHAV